MTSFPDARPANERLKSRFDEILAGSLIAAVAVHFLVLQMWPEMTATLADVVPPVVSDVIPFEDIDVPPPPPQLTHPAPPIATADAPPDATMAPMDWELAGRPEPPPPPPDATTDREASPFVVFDVPPRLTNPAELQRALERVYPSALRDAGIGGTVRLQIHIDEQGRALDGRVVGPSGYATMDDAALGLIDVMRFSPAMNRDRRVSVWVEIPIEFRTRGERGGVASRS